MNPRKKPKLTPWEDCEKQYLAFKFAYIGFNYDGVAGQQNTKNTVEEHIFQALLRTNLINERKTCGYSLCGRTDKGVSAAGNVFSISLRSRSGGKEGGGYNYLRMINKQLPDDIRILACNKVPHYFDARFSCIYREYKYFFMIRGLNIEKMRIAANYFRGTHDFKNFCKDDPEKKRNTMRRVLSCSININQDVGEICVRGYSFLWHQVRCMVAVLFKVGAGDEEIEIVQRMLDFNGNKPQYELASEIPLVLYECAFETETFLIDHMEDSNQCFWRVFQGAALRMEVIKCVFTLFKEPSLREKKKKQIKLS